MIVGFFVPFTLINPLNTLISLFLHPSPPSFYPHISLCIFIFPYIHSFATINYFAYSFQRTFSSVLASTSNPKRSQRIRVLKLGSTNWADNVAFVVLFFLGSLSIQFFSVPAIFIKSAKYNICLQLNMSHCIYVYSNSFFTHQLMNIFDDSLS